MLAHNTRIDMKKIILFIAVLLCVSSCYTQTNTEEGKYIVEEKYECPAGYIIWMSDIDNPSCRHRIEIGQYTYEHTSPGDTIVIKYGQK